MKGQIRCSCCALPVIVSEKHIGKAVVCPRTKRRLLIGRKSHRPDPWWAVLVAVLLIAGGVAAWPQHSPKVEPVAKTVTKDPIAAPEPEPVLVPTIVVAKMQPLPRETAPMPREPEPEVAEIAPEPQKLPPEPGYTIRYELPKRLDLKSAAQIEEQLLNAREVALDTDAKRKESKALLGATKLTAKVKKLYMGPLLLAQKRPELAGLPYCIGSAAELPKAKAEAMDTLAARLRNSFESASPSKEEFRPSIEKLYGLLGNVSGNSTKPWATAEAVPCIRQMLQPENSDIRRMSSELLSDLQSAEATAALVQWAVFDTDSANRAAALHSLQSRNRRAVSEQVAKYLSYPWAPAVEHACEALVALECTEAIPDLLAAKSQADPDAAYELNLPNGTGGLFRREVVRVNHARNCLLCHAVSMDKNDLLKARVPDPALPLPPAGSVAYYASEGDLVAASTTYLRQDFSIMQPVESPGPWPKMQRYDYMVAVRRDLSARAAVLPNLESRYQRAYDFALTGLGAAVPEMPPAKDDRRLAETARFVSLQLHPEALHALKSGKPLLEQSPSELEATTIALQHRHGPKANRVALVAYFAEAAENGTETQREKAAKLLALVRGSVMDYDLPARLARIAKALQ